MPRDYAKTPRPRSRTGLPGWVWMLGGLVIGLFVALLVYLDKTHPERDAADIAGAVSGFFQKQVEKAKPSAPETQAQDGKTAPTRPRFDFYTILPELEVAIPEEELVEKSQQPASTTTPGNYMLQAGSFRSAEQADQLRARLALQGIEASIQTVKIKGGETWHRVRVGPLPDIASVNRVRKRLRAIGIPSIVVRDKS